MSCARCRDRVLVSREKKKGVCVGKRAIVFFCVTTEEKEENQKIPFEIFFRCRVTVTTTPPFQNSDTVVIIQKSHVTSEEEDDGPYHVKTRNVCC